MFRRWLAGLDSVVGLDVRGDLYDDDEGDDGDESPGGPVVAI